MDLSPDGSRLAVQVADHTDSIWIYDLERREGRTLATGSSAYYPLWTPDSRSVTFSTGRPGMTMVQDVEGGHEPRALGSTAGGTPSSWTSDGEFVARNGIAGGIEFLSGGGAAVPEGPRGTLGVFSPNDRWIAYTSDTQIWLRSFPDGGAARQISAGFGSEAVWCGACDELFYRRGNQWLANEVSLSPDLSWEPSYVAFETDIIGTDGISYDVSADGERLIVVKRTREPERTKLQVVTNWFEKLERISPTR